MTAVLRMHRPPMGPGTGPGAAAGSAPADAMALWWGALTDYLHRYPRVQADFKHWQDFRTNKANLQRCPKGAEARSAGALGLVPAAVRPYFSPASAPIQVLHLHRLSAPAEN